MPIEQLILLVSAIVLAHLGVLAVVVVPRLAGRRADGLVEGSGSLALAAPHGAGLDEPGDESGVAHSVSALDRVVRVVSLLFLAAAGIVVTISGTFAALEIAIYLLLAMSTIAIVLIGDLIPAGRLGRNRQVLQVSVAIAVVTLLVALTGGVRSPFVAGYFLIVAGAALSSEDMAPTILAVVSSLAYLLVAALASNGLELAAVAWAVVNVAALGLLAYVATVAGRQQRRARESALRLARFDPLTGLYTRNLLFSTIEREIVRASRTGRGFCLLMLDLDDLKLINDTYGHPVGDRVIRAIADVIRRSIRDSDLGARYGGDEFMLVLPETDATGAVTVAAKLRGDIASLALRVDSQMIRTSVSVGLVSYPEDGATLDQLLAAVDAAMYESKRRGKNQIVGYVTRSEHVPATDPYADPDELTVSDADASAGGGWDRGRARSVRPSLAPAAIAAGGLPPKVDRPR